MDKQWLNDLAQSEAEKEDAFMSIVIAASMEDDEEGGFSSGFVGWADAEDESEIPENASYMATLISSLYEHFAKRGEQFLTISRQANRAKTKIPWLGDHEATKDLKDGVLMILTLKPVEGEESFETNLGVYMSKETSESELAGVLTPLFGSIIYVLTLGHERDQMIHFIEDLLSQEPVPYQQCH